MCSMLGVVYFSTRGFQFLLCPGFGDLQCFHSFPMYCFSHRECFFLAVLSAGTFVINMEPCGVVVECQ